MIEPVGARASTTIVAVAEALSLPATSLAFTEIALLPDVRLVRAHDHVVAVGYVTAPIVAVGHVTIMEEASVAFVPVMVWLKLPVGEVTTFITGCAGAMVSRVTLIEAVPVLPAESVSVTVTVLAPSVKVNCFVLGEPSRV